MDYGVSFHQINNTGDARGAHHSLPAGIFSQETFSDIHVVEIKSGAVRGNHRHSCRELLIVSYADCWQMSWQRGDENPCARRFSGSGVIVVDCAPGVVHAIKNTAGGRTSLLLTSFYCGSEAAQTERQVILP